ncbi:CLUMA_CG016990, isoform A [Clunio marinus]|uniref:CLUMA_CG016990, isoform A n=1 Tax=Clunio marinus TaxID=568069 RepID=A0A1J1IXG5_9DIPT|nr:CLUMA_CG016990, isoform A [Clunio marinus]
MNDCEMKMNAGSCIQTYTQAEGCHFSTTPHNTNTMMALNIHNRSSNNNNSYDDKHSKTVCGCSTFLFLWLSEVARLVRLLLMLRNFHLINVILTSGNQDESGLRLNR